MLRRKLLTLSIATILSISTITFWIIFLEGEKLTAFISMALFISLYAGPAILLYGLPVSLLSEKLTKNVSDISRLLKSFIIHIFFGMSYVFIIGVLLSERTLFTDFSQFWRSNEDFFIASTLTAIIFWMTDEILRFCPQLKTPSNF